MKDTAIMLFGISIIIKYRLHDYGYIEWHVHPLGQHAPDTPAQNNTKLLDLLLRTNHAGLVESMIREHEHYDAMAQAAGHQDRNPF